MRQKSENRESVRKEKTTEERERAKIHEKCGGKCVGCRKNIQTKDMHIDHITLLARGGKDDDPNNLQVLCKKCHGDKTKEEELEEGCFKLSETESSFNLKTNEIFNSELCLSFAFGERLQPVDERNKVLHHLDPRFVQFWHLDVNKSRANRLHYSDYDCPLFTVMDGPAVPRACIILRPRRPSH